MTKTAINDDMYRNSFGQVKPIDHKQTIGKCLLSIVLTIFLVTIAVMLLLNYAAHDRAQEIGSTITFSYFVGTAASLTGCAACIKKGRKLEAIRPYENAKKWFTTPKTMNGFGARTALCTGLSAAAFLCIRYSSMLFGCSIRSIGVLSLEELVKETGNSVIWIYVTLSVLVVPAFEEICFRGMIADTAMKYCRRRPPMQAKATVVTVTAIFFGLMHGSLIQMPFAIAAGLVLGGASAESESLLIPICLHGIFNLTASALEVISVFSPLIGLLAASIILMLSVLMVALGPKDGLFSKVIGQEPLADIRLVKQADGGDILSIMSDWRTVLFIFLMGLLIVAQLFI